MTSMPVFQASGPPHAIYVYVDSRPLKATPYDKGVIVDVAKAYQTLWVEGREQIPGTPDYDADANRVKPVGRGVMAEGGSRVLLRAPAIHPFFTTRQELCCRDVAEPDGRGQRTGNTR